MVLYSFVTSDLSVKHCCVDGELEFLREGMGVGEHVLSTPHLQARGSERCLLSNPHPSRYPPHPSCPQSIGSEPGAPGWGRCNDLAQATEQEMDQLGLQHISGTPSLSPVPSCPKRGFPSPHQRAGLELWPSGTPTSLCGKVLPGPQRWCMTAGSPNGQERSAFVGCFFFFARQGRGDQSFGVSSHARFDAG